MKLIRNYILIIPSLTMLAAPIILGGLINRIPGLVSSIMVARLGSKELAASGLITALLFSFIIIICSLFFPVSIFVGKEYAGKKYEEVGRIFQQSCFLAILIGFIVSVIVWHLGVIVKWLEQPPELIALVTSYLHGYAIGIIPLLCFFCCEQFVMGVNKSYLVLIWSMINIIVVIIPGYGMLYGKFGLPELGMAGVAYSTSLAYWFNFILALATFNWGKHYQAYHLFHNIFGLKLDYLKKLLQVGWPISVLYAIELSILFLVTIFIGWINAYALGAQQIAMQLELTALVVITGISFASGVLISQAIGRNDYAIIKNIGFASVIFCVSIMIIIGFCYLFFVRTLAAIFIDINNPTNESIIKYVEVLLPISAILQIFAATYNVMLSSLRGFHDTKFPMYLVAFISLLVSLPLAYGFGFFLGLGAAGVKLGLSIGYLIMGVILYWRFWIKSMEYL